MKKLFYALSFLSLLTIILLSIFFSGYIAFSLIIWVLCFGYGIYKFINSSNENEYEEKDEKMDEEEKDEEVNLKLSSEEEKIVDDACELITKFYFSKNYKELMKNLSGNEIQVIDNWLKNFISTEEIETKHFDSNIFASIKSENFEKMLYLSSGLCYDKNGNPTEEYKKAIGTYNKIKIAAKNLLQNNNLLTNITDNEDFESNCLKLLGKPLFLVTYYSLAFYPQWFDDENQISPQDEIKINPSDYWNDTAINPNDENKISPNFYGMYIALRKTLDKKMSRSKRKRF